MTEIKKTAPKVKICSRGHKYQVKGPCPVCWPGGVNKSATKKPRR